MQISVTAYSFNPSFKSGEMSIKEFIEYCGSLEAVKGVELLSYFWRDQEAEKRMVGKWLADNNLELAAYGIGNNFAHADKEVLNQQIARTKEGIDIAAELGAPCLRIFGGSLRAGKGSAHDPSWGVWGTTLPEGTTREEACTVAIDVLASIIGYAEEKNVILAIENHGQLPGTIAETKRFLDEINSPYLKLTLDTGSFLGAGEDPVEAFKALAPMAVHVHLKDVKKAPPGAERPYAMTVAGQGEVDFPGCIAQLKKAGYDKFLSIEFEGHGDPKVGVEQSVNYINGVILGGEG